MKLTEQQMYNALIEKDSQFDGIFYAAIKTTGIFCKPTCHARKPKAENVEYFDTQTTALAHGYRPCKICKPMEVSTVPQWVHDLLHKVEENPSHKFKDKDLRNMNLKPNTVRRWFQKEYGMTFHAYARLIRINHAFKKIKKGQNVLDTAMDAGYESLSGFSTSFKNTTGNAPTIASTKNIISIKRIETPLGPMLAGASDRGICLLEFTDRRMLETQLEILAKRFKATLLPGESSFFKLLEQELQEYFAGSRQVFHVPLDMQGTTFQEQVWNVLQTIPYAETRSYKQQAISINNPKAVRAVARANGENRIAIIIPCHRVIGANGQLVGYGGGVWRKKYLLDLEKRNR